MGDVSGDESFESWRKRTLELHLKERNTERVLNEQNSYLVPDIASIYEQ